MHPAAARELARLAVITQARRSAAPSAASPGPRAESLRLAAEVPVPPREATAGLLSSGNELLDTWLGGLPAGRVTEILGPASAGKTTLGMSALRAAAETPGRRRLAALVDLTRTVAPQEAWTRRLLVVRPRRLELGLRALDVLLDSASFSLVVVHLPPSLRSLPDALRVRAARLCREAGTALIACGEHSLFGSCSALRIELIPSGEAVLARVSKNRQGPVGERPLAPLLGTGLAGLGAGLAGAA